MLLAFTVWFRQELTPVSVKKVEGLSFTLQLQPAAATGVQKIRVHQIDIGR